MPTLFPTQRDAVASFTISLAPAGVGLGNGLARQSTMVSNTTDRGAMLVQLKIRSSGSAPTAGATYEPFLLRGNGSGYRTDGAGASDAVIVIENATPLPPIVVTASMNKDFYGDFDTAPLGPLDEEFGIAIRNSSGQALNATEANHTKQYETYVPVTSP